MGANSYLMVREIEDGLRLQLNGREGKSTTLELYMKEEPLRIEATPSTALKESSWDKTHHCLALKFSLSEEAVLIKIGISR